MRNLISKIKAIWTAYKQQAEQPCTSSPVEIGSEAPIRTKLEDRLRRTDYAERIAQVLSELSPREGRVFSIRGGWGYGKSSLKYLVIEQLGAKSKTADWLEFNPWQWGDGNAIARALFSQIADQLGGDLSKDGLARAEKLRKYGAILTSISAPLKKTSGDNSLISSVLTSASVVFVASSIGFDLPNVAKIAAGLAVLAIVTSLAGRWLTIKGRDRSNEPLDKIREQLESHLQKLKQPLIVFVDDIDRLEPDQIRLLLRQVKANANLPNIVFVLLFQPSIVERALDPVADGDGRAFLEKIVQANFDLPAVPVQTVQTIFTEQLSELAGRYATEANGFEDVRWGNALFGCILPHVRNMRDARRLISSIAVHLPLHATGDLLEVNLIDFFVLETVRVFEPDLHMAIFRERSLVLQERRFSGDRRDPEFKAAAERLVESTQAEDRDYARNTIRFLFPPIEWAFGGTHFSSNFRTQWLSAKQVCTSRFFPRYFELQTAVGEMSEQRFVDFLAAAATEDTLASSVAEIESDGLLSSLAARLDESVERLPLETPEVLLPGMFLIAQKLVASDGDPFSSPWVCAWRATSWYLKRIPEDQRGGLALEALRVTKGLSIASMLIHLSDPAERGDEDRSDVEPALDLETIEAMKVVWLNLVRAQSIDVKAMLEDPDLVRLLYRWKEYSADQDEPRRWLLEAIDTDQGFVEMATSMMSTGRSHTAGDRVSKVHNMFSRSAFADFIGLEFAKARCDAINPDDHPGHEVALKTLHDHLVAWQQNNGDWIYR
ncbi:KAP family P-loop NTPase fold protein [Pseudomonas sp. NPDC089554]|uniref:KAP family P-loop NTPase fold protein n=1 Tax=Pseudomonas sp. NPDC089554 TaxID=3390653 RepID=UPI003D047470